MPEATAKKRPEASGHHPEGASWLLFLLPRATSAGWRSAVCTLWMVALGVLGGLMSVPGGAQKVSFASDGMAVPLSESAVHDIQTRTLYEDGSSEVRHGTGFVVGRQFYTVFHNIDVLGHRGDWQRKITLGGVEVEPRIVDKRNDVAIFDVPALLCPHWCNDRDPDAMPPGPSHHQSIGWFEFVSLNDERKRRQARIIEVMFKNYHAQSAGSACDSDVVIAVDQPFFPGSSGGPVWDLASKRLLGMVQGSFVRESGEQVGYYKPFECVRSVLTGALGPSSVELSAR